MDSLVFGNKFSEPTHPKLGAVCRLEVWTGGDVEVGTEAVDVSRDTVAVHGHPVHPDDGHHPHGGTRHSRKRATWEGDGDVYKTT